MKRVILVFLGALFCLGAVFPTVCLAIDYDVLCVGESLTCGSGSTWDKPVTEITEENTYPARLGVHLGAGYNVRNYGISGVAVLPEPTWDWASNGYLVRAKGYTGANNPFRANAKVVYIFLGTNDAKPRVWNIESGGAENFHRMYTAIVRAFLDMLSQPEVICVVPPPVLPEGVKGESYTIDDNILKNEVSPIIRQVAEEQGCKLVDLRALFPDPITEQDALLALMADGAHPNPDGYDAIAREMARVYTRVPGDANNTGSTTIADVTELAKYLAGWSITIRTDSADVNADGLLNIDDLCLIAQWVAEWNVVLR